jgi:uncharacterized protein YqkB
MEIHKSTLGNLKQVGRKNQTYDDVISQRIKCDAEGCEAAGSNQIRINAGKFGTVTLFVCSNCIGKFLD